MVLWIELLKFFGFLTLLVVISKYVLVKALRVLGESLGLSAKIAGEIAGFATSAPELLTVIVSSASGLMAASAYNILSSNVVNLILYSASILINKNLRFLKSKALSSDLLLVLITILIPSLMMVFGLESSVALVPAMFVLFFVFYFISRFVHKKYPVKKEETGPEEGAAEETGRPAKNRLKALLSAGAILVTGVVLYLLCVVMGDNLSNLAYAFHIPELILGIVLGFITSIPEMITFFESQRHFRKEENRNEGVVEATSNLLMSNVFNLFIILALGTLIYCFVK